MYAMVQTQSGTPYAGAKGMLRTIFGLDYLGDDALAVKQALMKVNALYDHHMVDARYTTPGVCMWCFGYINV